MPRLIKLLSRFICMPSFVIILLVAAVLRSVLRYAGVQAVLDGVRPCVVAMILATAVTMGLSTMGGYTAGPAGTKEKIKERGLSR